MYLSRKKSVTRFLATFERTFWPAVHSCGDGSVVRVPEVPAEPARRAQPAGKGGGLTSWERTALEPR